MGFNSISELIDDIRAGKMIILLDDESRENEGDFVMAAEAANAQAINFMIKEGRGLVCAPLSPELCDQLELPMMAAANGSRFSTQFTISVEAAQGVTTGISAMDRACTIAALVAEDAKPNDLVQPGHVFPIRAAKGGVLTRAGHTEASTDLAELAGFKPASVIVEILNEDGSMARRDDLFKIAQQHNIKIGTIADLIRYRIEHEPTVTSVACQNVEHACGAMRLHTLKDNLDGHTHYALEMGSREHSDCPLVRVHYHDLLADTLALKMPGKTGWSLPEAIKRVRQSPWGFVVLLNSDIETQSAVSSGRVCSYVAAANPEAFRSIGTGARILKALGVKKMSALSAPRKFVGLAGFGLEIVDCIPSENELNHTEAKEAIDA